PRRRPAGGARPVCGRHGYPRRPVRRALGDLHRSPEPGRGWLGSGPAVRGRPALGPRAAEPATRSTRWRRRPAPGTRWPRGASPGAPSRTRIPGRERVGLPGEPGRGFSEDVPLFAEDLDLPAQPTHFFPLLGG